MRPRARKRANPYVVVADASYGGRYEYSFDAISPQCGKVTLEIFSSKDPEHPFENVLDDKVVARLWHDFEPYRKVQAQQASAGAQH